MLSYFTPEGFNSVECSVWMPQILLLLPLTLTSNCTAVCPFQVLGHLLALSTLTWDLHQYPCSGAQESHIRSTWSLQSWVILWELFIPHPSHCHLCACLWTLQIQAQKSRSSEKMGFSFQLIMAARARTVKLAVLLCWFWINKHQKLLNLLAHLLSVVSQWFCFTDIQPCSLCSPTMMSAEFWDSNGWSFSGQVNLFIF